MKLIPALMPFGLAATLAGGALLNGSAPKPAALALDTSGHETPQDGAYFENGWNVANTGAADLMDRYLRYQSFLGEPVSGFNGQCQSFRFGRLCYQPANPSDWKVELANVGLEDLQVQGYSAQPGRDPHPALRDWLYMQLEAGVDLTRVVGRLLSESICDARTRLCRQWADKQVFQFPQDSLTADQVQRLPVGLWLSHPQARPAPVAGSSESASPLSPWPWALVVVLVLVGLLVLMRRSVGANRGAV